MNEILNKVFASIDKQLKLVGSLQNGCTCVFVLVEKTKSGKSTVTFAHIGDSRAVLSSGGIAKRMTDDHKGSNPSE